MICSLICNGISDLNRYFLNRSYCIAASFVLIQAVQLSFS